MIISDPNIKIINLFCGNDILMSHCKYMYVEEITETTLCLKSSVFHVYVR